ncbi:type VII secretion system-associated protein [Streptomyces sp. NPDC002870]|uniref:type VII secretion system-associated protein n=1 Tax=Streptomyces sp. NPDC002870 TaxID=3364666 RepID=UPI00369B389C
MSDERDETSPIAPPADDADSGTAASAAQPVGSDAGPSSVAAAGEDDVTEAVAAVPGVGTADTSEGITDEEDDEEKDEGPLWQPVSSPDEVPDPPEEIARAARLAPEHYFYMHDPNWSGEGVPPPFATVGRWRSDDKGEIVDWEDYRDYRPSAQALGWEEPADETDAAVHAAVTGYGPAEAVASALVTAHLEVFLDDGGRPSRSEGPEGTTAIPVFTLTPSLADADLPPHRHIAVPELIEELEDGEEVLYLSPTSPVSAAVPPDVLRRILAEDESGQAGESGGEAAEAVPEPVPGTEVDELPAQHDVAPTPPPQALVMDGGLVGADAPWEAWAEGDAATAASGSQGAEGVPGTDGDLTGTTAADAVTTAQETGVAGGAG